jgi:serine/threonine protein kinase
MEATLITPFNSYCTHVGFGAAGHVLAISENAVFKGPILLDNPAPSQREIMEDAIKSIENEKTMHRMLQRHAHPNIVHSISVLPEGIFLERLGMSLAERLTPTALPVDPGLEVRWIQQLVSAVVWLEGLGIAHRDLRPSNILLDTSQNLKLIDFDCAVKFGEELIAGGAPFCKRIMGSNHPRLASRPRFSLSGLACITFTLGTSPGLSSMKLMDMRWRRNGVDMSILHLVAMRLV